MIGKKVYISWTDFNWHAYLQAKTFNSEIKFISSFKKIKTDGNKLLKFLEYIKKSYKSLYIIFKVKPLLLFTEDPPPISSIIAIIIRPLLKYKFVIDAHNGAFENPMISIPGHKLALKKADAILVHNNPLKYLVENDKRFKDCKFFTLNDPIPEIPYYKSDDNKNYLLVVTTFHGDEPIEIVLEGIIAFLSKYPDTEIEFRLTGNFNKKIHLYYKYKHPKIIFLGFVEQKIYHQKLVNALGVISYSVRERVQQFALMEALGAGVPFISNKNLTNLELFDNKMVLTEITPDAIAEGIQKFLLSREALLSNINSLKHNLSAKRAEDLAKIKKHLGILD